MHHGEVGEIIGYINRSLIVSEKGGGSYTMYRKY